MPVAKPSAESGPLSSHSNQREDTLSFPPMERSETLKFPPSQRRSSGSMMSPSSSPSSSTSEPPPAPSSSRTRPGRDARTGDVIAQRYVLEELLATGAMGVVWRAHDQQESVPVAVKLVSPRLALASEATERLRAEAEVLKRIESPHVARILDAGQLEGGSPYLVTELLRGETLQAVIEQGTGVALRDALAWTSQAADGLADVHALGLVHDDLKPSNLFLVRCHGKEPTIKLLDFGVARALSTPVGGLDAILGNPWYLAPERMWANQDADQRSDIWSLGVILYELVAGRRPFEGRTLQEVCASVTTATPAPLSSWRPEASPELERIVSRCLQPQPEDRYSNARQLALELKAALGADAAPTVGRALATLSSTLPQPPREFPRAATALARTTSTWRPRHFNRASAPRRRWPALLAYAIAGSFVVLIGMGAVIKQQERHTLSVTHPNAQTATPGHDPESATLPATPSEGRGLDSTPAPGEHAASPAPAAGSSKPIAQRAASPAPATGSSKPIAQRAASPAPATGSSKPIARRVAAAAARDARVGRPWRRTNTQVSLSRPESELGIPVNRVYINARGELVDAQGRPLRQTDTTGPTPPTSSNSADTTRVPERRSPSDAAERGRGGPEG